MGGSKPSKLRVAEQRDQVEADQLLMAPVRRRPHTAPSMLSEPVRQILSHPQRRHRDALARHGVGLQPGQLPVDVLPSRATHAGGGPRDSRPRATTRRPRITGVPPRLGRLQTDTAAAYWGSTVAVDHRRHGLSATDDRGEARKRLVFTGTARAHMSSPSEAAEATVLP
jgi:hypothetical protein